MAAAGGKEIFDKGSWYHEALEDGLAISYRVRAPRLASPHSSSCFSKKDTTEVGGGRRPGG